MADQVKTLSDMTGKELLIEFGKEAARGCDVCSEPLYAELLRRMPEWVSVETRMPELSGMYIVQFKSGAVSSAHWNRSAQRWGNILVGTGWRIVYWQPFPKPPAPPTTTEEKA